MSLSHFGSILCVTNISTSYKHERCDIVTGDNLYSVTESVSICSMFSVRMLHDLCLNVCTNISACYVCKLFGSMFHYPEIDLVYRQ